MHKSDGEVKDMVGGGEREEKEGGEEQRERERAKGSVC